MFYFVWRSLWNRRWISSLIIASIALGVVLLLTIERLRVSTQESFEGAISKVDLVVGARTSPTSLLLYSVFNLGAPTNVVSMKTYEHFQNHPAVEWAIPYSLGDSHRGYRVVATTDSFFKNYRYLKDRSLNLRDGQWFRSGLEVVIGSEVARLLNYKIGASLILSHSASEDGLSIEEHQDQPFTVVGILESTSTPIDRSLYISLESMELIHLGWGDDANPVDQIRPQSINSFFIRAKSRLSVLGLQREIANYDNEPLTAAIPAVVLSEFWGQLTQVDSALRLISLCVLVVGLLSMVVSFLLSMEIRQRELMLLRALGSSRALLIRLVISEAFVLSSLAVILGLLLTFAFVPLVFEIVQSMTGLGLGFRLPSLMEFAYCGGIILLAVLVSLLPAIRLYKSSLLSSLNSKI